MIEILIAFRANAWEPLKSDIKDWRVGRVRKSIGGKKAKPRIPKRLIKFLQNHRGAPFETIQQSYTSPTIAGREYRLVSVITSEAELELLTELNTRYGNLMIIVGVRDYTTGLEYRLTEEVDENSVKTTPGKVAYPMPTQAKLFVPDVIKYDKNNIETSRTVATKFKWMHRMSGQAHGA